MQAEGRGGLHSVPQDQLLHGVPRDLRPPGRPPHEDGHCQGALGGRKSLRHGPEDGLLRRPHTPRLRLQAQVGRRSGTRHLHTKAGKTQPHLFSIHYFYHLCLRQTLDKQYKMRRMLTVIDFESFPKFALYLKALIDKQLD